MTQSDPILLPRRRFPWPGLLAPVVFAILTLLLFNDALYDVTKVLAGNPDNTYYAHADWAGARLIGM